MNHIRQNYSELTIALNVDITRYNEKNHLINDIIDEEFSLMFNKNEMKKIIGEVLSQNSSIAMSTWNIMIDEIYEHFKRDSIL